MNIFLYYHYKKFYLQGIFLTNPKKRFLYMELYYKSLIMILFKLAIKYYLFYRQFTGHLNSCSSHPACELARPGRFCQKETIGPSPIMCVIVAFPAAHAIWKAAIDPNGSGIDFIVFFADILGFTTNPN